VTAVAEPGPTSLFVRVDDDLVLPTGLSRGPWSPDALHGAPVAILAAGAVEAVESDQPMMVSRITLELERPVPLAPLRATTVISRPGRKVRVVDVDISTPDGTRVARARALQQRLGHVDLPDDPLLDLEPPPPGRDGIARMRSDWSSEHLGYHLDATDLRFVEGDWVRPGPIVVWVHLTAEVFPGVAASPLQRVCAAADFGNGVSSVLPYQDYVFINPDLTIHLLRPPTEEWVAMRTTSTVSATGTGMAESALYDSAGRLGRSVQSLFVDRA